MSSHHLYAREIIASVKDFDFGHVVTFLNRLSDIELESLLPCSKTRRRRLTIEMTFVSTCAESTRRPYYSNPNDFHPDYDLLGRWLNRTSHPTKRGTTIDVTYVRAQQRYKTDSITSHLGYLLGHKLGEGRAMTETEKIIKAVCAVDEV